MLTDLDRFLPKDIIHTRLIDRLAYAHDASLYRMVPKGVVRPSNEQEIITLLKYSNDTSVPITFRAAGTSLSGQSVGEGIVAETIRDWKKWDILDNGQSIRLEPGIIGGYANRYLSPFHRKIGPDPASINSCMIGGILANNASGMVCGVKNNAYHTMNSVRFITANGKTYDTSIPDDYHRFISEEDHLVSGIEECRDQIRQSNELTRRIQHKYQIKNTVGYSINSFLDYDHPLDIFAHLLIGSEGTLAFISSVVLNTVKNPPFQATGLILFDTIEQACSSIPVLSDRGASALELMDYASLTTVKYLDTPPFNAKKLIINQAGLLCEFESGDDKLLNTLVNSASGELGKLGGKFINPFTMDSNFRENLWKVRKGLYPTVGALRIAGKSVITEDICVRMNDLPHAVKELHHIFKSWNYDDAVVFGHAKDGNLHFVASIDLNNPKGIKQFDGMIEDLVSMTVDKFNGSLKAEHGTGRNMTPFVKTEWGSELYDIMWKIKSLADPNMILNPGVLLDKGKRSHLKNLKQMPLVSDDVDLCVECGFCESICPSRNLTLTPRQRIAVSRDMVYLKLSSKELKELKKDFDYDGNMTCATDGLCAIKCPVKIDTGKLIKTNRNNSTSLVGEYVSNILVRNFSFLQKLFRVGLKIGTVIGSSNMIKITKGLRRMRLNIPEWNIHLSSSPDFTIFSSGEGIEMIYFPSCVQRTFGVMSKKSLISMMMEIAPILGVKLIIPDSIHSLCCSMPFASKGYSNAAKLMIQKTADELYTLTKHGQIPVLMDMSPCMYQIKNVKNNTKLNKIIFIDFIELLYEKRAILEQYEPMNNSILIHPTCSNQKLDQAKIMASVLSIMAKEIILPEPMECCGTAGDKGLWVPELTSSAGNNCLNNYPKIPDKSIGVSTSRMCEMTMTTESGVEFYSIIELVYQYLNVNDDN